jgi:hypothetical protein
LLPAELEPPEPPEPELVLLLEPPQPATNTATTAVNTQALFDLVIWTFSSQRSLRRRADSERVRRPVREPHCPDCKRLLQSSATVSSSL